MLTVSMKHVQEGAEKQQKKWKDSEQMGSMLGQKKKGADRQKADQNKCAARGQEAASGPGLLVSVIMMRHAASLQSRSASIAVGAAPSAPGKRQPWRGREEARFAIGSLPDHGATYGALLAR
jgi:hypothetical protein